MLLEPIANHVEVGLLDFVAHAATVSEHSGLSRCPRPQEWIKHGIADEGEHPDQAIRQLHGEGSRVATTSASTRHVAPYCPKPFGVVFFVYETKETLVVCRFPITTGLSEEKDILDIVLHDPVWFIRLSKERRSVAFNFRGRIRNLVPQDWSQIVESQLATVNRDVGVQRNDQVPTNPLPRYAHISDNDTETAARD